MLKVSGSILDRILEHKRVEVTRQKRELPLVEVRATAESVSSGPDFLSALHQPPGAGPALIAEIKRASPSRGSLAENLDPTGLARLYKNNGAAAISVLTDERFFLGSLEDLRAVAGDELTGLPTLRKDFIFDSYQIYQARLAGASAALLIAACLEAGQLAQLLALTGELHMAALVEVHNREELETALRCGASLVGVNNRDLRDFSVDLGTTTVLAPYLPEEATLVSESGIHTRADVARLAKAGVHAVLVGEALVTAEDTAAKTRELSCFM